MNVALIVLAAGQGSRMKSDLPKVLHQVASAPLVVHALKAGLSLAPNRIAVVTGHGADAVERALSATEFNAKISFHRQTEQLGTAHAVDQARDALQDFDGKVVVLYGDTPFITGETLAQMIASDADITVLGFETSTPGRYGRLIANGTSLDRIVEAKDATDAELAVTLCNSGVICAQASALFDLIAKVSDDNAAGEYYLTDIIALGRDAGLSAEVVTCDEAETLGINTRVELAQAEAAFQTRARIAAMTNGVTLMQPDTTYFAHDTQIGRDTVIGPNTVFGPGVVVEDNATINAFCHLENCHVASGAVIGPYARLRPGADVQTGARIGNFVEIKKATIAPGAKVNHLSYIGDAHVGERANIGAGTITCNYDGVLKHQTQIGADSFIGSNTMLVAPVSVGKDAMTATGTIVTTDVPDGDMAIGRVRQENKPGFARKLMQALRLRKQGQGK